MRGGYLKRFVATAVAAYVLVATFSAASAQTARRQDFNRDVVYQIITDRFNDGDTANNNPPQSSGLYDATKTDWGKYWGGDLAGITAKLDYLKNMGVTAIWISPPLDNRNVVGSGGSTAPYHGYEMRDTQTIEEHFGDSANSWSAFDALVSAAHFRGIKVIVDFAPNHSNLRGTGEDGRLAASGSLLATYGTDSTGFFHHGANISGSQWDQEYPTEYLTIYDLADLNQENASVDAALKNAVTTFQSHGVDGFRLDATKHVNWGWQYSLANKIYANGHSFIFGEWVADDSGNPLYGDLKKFTNRSGVSEINFPLYTATTNVFAYDHAFSELDAVVAQQNTDFAWKNDLVNFVDNHDRPRFLNKNASQNRLHEAMAFVLAARGIPCVYYGDEQYLYNTTNGGNDPYNRPMMSSWSETTTAFQLVQKLSTLRKNNPALAYGGSQQRWINNDVYIFERKFFNSVVVVAINKNETSSVSVTNLLTSLPTGTYTDYLGGLLGGLSLTSTGSAGGGNYNAANFMLPPHAVCVWQYNPSTSSPQVGAIEPTVAPPGVTVSITGQGFGTTTGTVKFGTTAATVTSWSDKQVICTVPSVANGDYSVTVTRAGGTTASNAITFTVLRARLIPVTFTVYNAYTNQGENIYLTGNTVELGNWSTSAQLVPGPFNNPDYPTWFLTVSVPAGASLQFKFVKLRTDGSLVEWEPGATNHTYTVPTSGTGFVNKTWGVMP